MNVIFFCNFLGFRNPSQGASRDSDTAGDTPADTGAAEQDPGTTAADSETVVADSATPAASGIGGPCKPDRSSYSSQSIRA